MTEDSDEMMSCRICSATEDELMEDKCELYTELVCDCKGSIGSICHRCLQELLAVYRLKYCTTCRQHYRNCELIVREQSSWIDNALQILIILQIASCALRVFGHFVVFSWNNMSTTLLVTLMAFNLVITRKQVPNIIGIRVFTSICLWTRVRLALKRQFVIELYLDNWPRITTRPIVNIVDNKKTSSRSPSVVTNDVKGEKISKCRKCLRTEPELKTANVELYHQEVCGCEGPVGVICHTCLERLILVLKRKRCAHCRKFYHNVEHIVENEILEELYWIFGNLVQVGILFKILIEFCLFIATNWSCLWTTFFIYINKPMTQTQNIFFSGKEFIGIKVNRPKHFWTNRWIKFKLC